jgi:phage-related protein (TIGR01555 family)
MTEEIKFKDGQRNTLKNAVNRAIALVRSDDWVNSLTGLGTSGRDKRTYTSFGASSRITLQERMLQEVYGGNDLIRKIVDIYAEEQTREWFEIMVSDADGQQVATDMQTELQRLGVRESLPCALSWARLFGGGVLMLGINDGRRMIEPVDTNNIRSLEWVEDMDRWSVTISERYTSQDDVPQVKIGEPKVYMITADGDQTFVHESRVIRFDGIRTTRRRKKENNGWSDSALEPLWETVRDFDSGNRGVANVIQDFSQGVYKVKGLAALLAADQDDLVLKRLRQLDMARSHARAIPIDADGEDFERKGAGVSGLDGLLDRAMMRVSAGTGIPVSLLFGRSASGMNATGEIDIRSFYDRIKAMQETHLRPRIEYLLEILFLSSEGPTGGEMPENWSISFNALYQETEQEKQETRKTTAETDRIYVDLGVISPEEVRKSRFGGDAYSPETMIDENNAPAPTPAQNADRASDAPGYGKRGDMKRCDACKRFDGLRCNRWDFSPNYGYGCDDFAAADGMKEDAAPVVKLKGRNF